MKQFEGLIAKIGVNVEPSTKAQAEVILDELGLSMSCAVNVFLKQLIYSHGFPFDVKLPTARKTAEGTTAKEQDAPAADTAAQAEAE